MNRNIKIVIALVGALLITQVLSRTIFMDYSPSLNPEFLASAPRQVVNVLSSALGKLNPSILFNTGKKITSTNSFFGFNIYGITNLESADISETLNDVKQCNDNTVSVVRFWGFLGGDRIQKILDSSPDNMKFIVTLSNFYTSGVAQPWAAPQGNETQWFSTDYKTNGMRQFVDTVTQKYKGNPKIYMWEIMNEPNCTADVACSQAQHGFLSDVSDLIAQNDPGKLVSPGLQAQNTGGEHFDNGDFDAIAALPHITALSCHMYGTTDFDPTAVANCEQALQKTKSHNKVFYIGEAGLKSGCTTGQCGNSCTPDQLNTRKTNILNAKSHFDQLGSDGYVVWQFDLPGNEGLSCDGSSIFAGDPLCPATNGSTVPTNTPVPHGSPTPTKPPGGGNPSPTPTKPPGGGGGGNSGKVQINVHVGSTTGPLFTGTTPANPYTDPAALLVYLTGPSQKGKATFGEMLDVPGSAMTTCTSKGGFTYNCAAGTVTWDGADNKSGTWIGAYNVTLSQAPTGWKIVTGSANGTLTGGATLTFDLAISQ